MSSRMTSEMYPEGYWERGEGSNYVGYGDDPGWQPTLDVLTRLTDDPRHFGVRLLEVACAKGWFVLHARARGYDAWGVDISEYAIGQAHGAVAPFVQQHNAVDPLPFEQPFDVVISAEFLEHVPSDEIDQVLRNMIDVLRPGGLLVNRPGIDLEGDTSWDRFGTGGCAQQHDETHVLERPLWWWRAKMSSLGMIPMTRAEREFDAALSDRDWWARTLVYRKPS